MAQQVRPVARQVGQDGDRPGKIGRPHPEQLGRRQIPHRQRERPGEDELSLVEEPPSDRGEAPQQRIRHREDDGDAAQQQAVVGRIQRIVRREVGAGHQAGQVVGDHQAERQCEAEPADRDPVPGARGGLPVGRLGLRPGRPTGSSGRTGQPTPSAAAGRRATGRLERPCRVGIGRGQNMAGGGGHRGYS